MDIWIVICTSFQFHCQTEVISPETMPQAQLFSSKQARHPILRLGGKTSWGDTRYLMCICMCIDVHMYICILLCIYIYVYIYSNVSTVCIHIFLCVYIYICMAFYGHILRHIATYNHMGIVVNTTQCVYYHMKNIQISPAYYVGGAPTWRRIQRHGCQTPHGSRTCS